MVKFKGECQLILNALKYRTVKINILLALLLIASCDKIFAINKKIMTAIGHFCWNCDIHVPVICLDFQFDLFDIFLGHQVPVVLFFKPTILRELVL